MTATQTEQEGGDSSAAANPADWSTPITLRGIAKRAKSRRLLWIGESEFPVYVDGIDSWPNEQVDKEVTLVGRLEKKSFLPVATTLANGERTQGVAKGSEQWVLFVATPEKNELVPEALPIALLAAAYPSQGQCVTAIVAALPPTERLADFVIAPPRSNKGETRFALWHRSAFLPENRGIVGNPGGHSRDAVCLPGTPATVSFQFWQ